MWYIRQICRIGKAYEVAEQWSSISKQKIQTNKTQQTCRNNDNKRVQSRKQVVLPGFLKNGSNTEHGVQTACARAGCWETCSTRMWRSSKPKTNTAIQINGRVDRRCVSKLNNQACPGAKTQQLQTSTKAFNLPVTNSKSWLHNYVDILSLRVD